MQLKSLLVGAALLSNFALLTYGRAVELSRSDVSTTKLPDKVTIHHVIEPRVFKGIRKKINDGVDVAKGKKKANEGEDTTAGGPLEHPMMSLKCLLLRSTTVQYPTEWVKNPSYQSGNGLAHKKFLDIEIEDGRDPPATGGYLMYSGEAISSEIARRTFKNIVAEDPRIGTLHDWEDTFKNTPAMTMWNRYLQANPDKVHVLSFAVSFAQARRAAQSKPELHMLFSNADEPLMKDKSFWGAVEAGVITGPDSKVNKIWRDTAHEVHERQPLPAPTLAWDRNLHEPFGKKIDELDWRIYPKKDDQPDGRLETAVPKSPPPQIGTLPFEE